MIRMTFIVESLECLGTNSQVMVFDHSSVDKAHVSYFFIIWTKVVECRLKSCLGLEITSMMHGTNE